MRLKRGFTLIELLMVVAIIGILAAIMFGASTMVRNSARAAATRATITKLHNIIMERWESYQTRRVPVALNDTSGHPLAPKQAAEARLVALRQLMRLEMPDFFTDFSSNAATDPASLTAITDANVVNILGAFHANPPALWKAYNRRYTSSTPNTIAENAKCLYLFVSISNPQALEQFNQSEIGVDPNDHWPYFIDGWGTPILWLRYAPGFSSGATPPAPSEIQTADFTKDHDPFDTRNVDVPITGDGVCGDPSINPRAFRLVPLIYSFGPDRSAGVSIGPATGSDYTYLGDPYKPTDTTSSPTRYLGSILDSSANDNIDNHRNLDR